MIAELTIRATPSATSEQTLVALLAAARAVEAACRRLGQ